MTDRQWRVLLWLFVVLAVVSLSVAVLGPGATVNAMAVFVFESTGK